MLTDKKTSIIMPAYNEAREIFQNIEKVWHTFKKWEVPFEIIVVDDGSEDDTFKEAERASSARENVIVKRNRYNRGKGHALKEAFKSATGDYIIFLDSDLEIAPEQIGLLFEIRRKRHADVVIGSKRHRLSSVSYPIHRRIVSTGYFFLVKLLFGLPIHDTQTGLKLFKREVLSKVFPKILVKDYAVDLEILVNAHHLDYKIAEAPVVVKSKFRYGRIGLKNIYLMFHETLAIFYRMRLLQYYDREIPATDRMPLVSIIISAQEGSGYLKECLEACRNLDYPNVEILVADENMPPGQKRDLAARRARGELLAFIDDDAYPDVDWLKNAARHFSKEEIVGVAGPALTPPEDNFGQQASGLVYSSILVSGPNTYRYLPGMLRYVEDYPTVNLVVRKDSFNLVGGFNTHFWPGEDTFLCMRLTKELNKKILYDPDVIVYHHRRPLFRPHLRQVANYALHRGYFAKRFPETSLKVSYFMPSILTAGLFLGWAVLNRQMYINVILLYLLGVFLIGIKTFKIRMALAVIFGIISTHIVYGLNFLRGLLTRRLKEEF